LWSTSVVLVMLGYCFVVDFDVIVLLWFILIYFSVTYLLDFLRTVCSLHSTRTNSLGFDLPHGQWQIKVRNFGFHLVLSPVWGATPRAQQNIGNGRIAYTQIKVHNSQNEK